MKMSIIFVDDEPNILQGLKRTLRRQRNEWEMEFAESGKQALEILEKKSFDAIVSDMRMPGMDGAELLDKIKKLYPTMIRFILSGHSDLELVMRSVGPSHQYLAKPCDLDLLKSKLSGAFSLHKLLASNEIRSAVASMTSLPSLPHIYKQVVEALQSPDGSINAVGKLIEQDPGMATKVLQLVNSAYFGISRQISSAAEAANFIGLDILKSLVLCEGVFSQFNPSTLKVLSIDGIKNKSLAIAHAARKIAESEGMDKVKCDQAFLGGLLADLGTLVLAANQAEEYKRACKICKTNKIEMFEAEQQVFGTTHAEVAAYLLGLWGIDDVITAVAFHHRPVHFPHTQFSALTALSIAEYCYNHTEQDSFTEDDLSYLQSIGLIERIPYWQTLCRDINQEAA